MAYALRGSAVPAAYAGSRRSLSGPCRGRHGDRDGVGHKHDRPVNSIASTAATTSPSGSPSRSVGAYQSSPDEVSIRRVKAKQIKTHNVTTWKKTVLAFIPALWHQTSD